MSYWISGNNAAEKSAQLKNLKKALIAIEKLTNDSLKTKYASELSYKFYKANDSVNFKKANKLALLYSTKTRDSSKIAVSHWDAGDFFRDREIIDSAYYHYTQAHRLFKILKEDYNAGRMLYNMSKAQGTIRDYTAAETNIIDAISVFKSLDNPEKNKRLYHSYNYLAMLSNNLRDYDKSIEYHVTALEYLDKIVNKGSLLASSKNNIGAVYRDQGNYKDALLQFEAVVETDSIYFKDTELYAKALSNLGFCQFKLGDTGNGEIQLIKAIALQDSIRDDKSLSRSYYHLAELYLKNADTLSSLQSAKQAINKAQDSDNNLRVLETLGLLTKIDPKNATGYTDDYIKLSDSLQTAERRARNKFERIRFETNETLAENVLLSKQNQMWAAIAGVFMLLGIATYVIISQRRKNEQLRFQEEQQDSNQRIFNLLLSEKSKIEEGKKLAQKRISEELHDAVQSRLQGIRMLLLGLNKRTTPEAIEERGEAIKELKSVQEEVRAISHELSNAAYQKIYSFITTVQELLREVKKNTGLQSNFVFDKTVDWDNLNSEIKINVYRIIQESVQNCVKYAEAELIVVTFDFSELQLFKVIIEDNGKGFHVKSRKKGIGMRNINSRINKLGGEWEIQSEVGEGTKVILYIPTSKPENPSATAEMKIA